MMVEAVKERWREIYYRQHTLKSHKELLHTHRDTYTHTHTHSYTEGTH